MQAMSSMPPWALIIVGVLAAGLGWAIQGQGDGDAFAGTLIILAGAIAVIAGIERGWKERRR